jgi:hypothetical protein
MIRGFTASERGHSSLLLVLTPKTGDHVVTSGYVLTYSHALMVSQEKGLVIAVGRGGANDAIIIIISSSSSSISSSSRGYMVAQLIEALRYKPEGRGFDSRWSHWNFSVT